jgi:hypothetical protein
MSLAFFDTFNLENIQTSDFNIKINPENTDDRLVCVFFWGHDCPNCEIAKKVLVMRLKMR